MKIFPAQSVCPHCKTVYRYGDLNAIKFKKQTVGFVQGLSLLALFIINIIPAAAAVVLLPLYLELRK